MEAVRIELDGQYRALREGAGLMDRSTRGKLIVSGADAAEYLQGQLTNEVEGLTAPPAAGEVGSGCYAALLDRKGHLQADMRVLRLAPDEIWIDTEPEVIATVSRHLTMYSVGREVLIDDVGERWAVLSLIGPAAMQAAGVGPLADEHSHAELPGAPAGRPRAVRTDLGVDLIVAAADARATRARLVAAGALEVTEPAAEIVRVESGRPRFGREMNARTMPQEAGINQRAVSFTKGCYIGQETVARLHYRGKPNRQLRGLRLDEATRDGDPVVLGERALGTVGTAVISPALGPIALAILRREAEPGSRVAVGIEDDAIGGEVVALPFHGDAGWRGPAPTGAPRSILG